MALTFTYFRKTSFSRDVLVYPADLDMRPKHGMPPHPTYYLDMGARRFQLLQSSTIGSLPVLTGKREGLLGRTAIIRGDGLISTARRSQVLSNAWTFVYMADEFRWHVSRRTHQWVLRDRYGHELALFNRKILATGRIGMLCVANTVDLELLRLIVLTCEIVYRTVK